ncbi:MAG: helix-turn-helix domain-containing protein [Clostridia bacterium]|nr:helix-turn-helix domain-containing protein [Clostridia bacterium]
MKTVDINDLLTIPYAISAVSVIRQTNSWSLCSHPEGRGYNGFVLLAGGECVYRWEGCEAHLSPGALIYLPKGARHSVAAPERTLDLYRINLTVQDAKDSEEIVFSSLPHLVTDSAPKNIFDISEELRKITLLPDGGFRCVSMICELLEFVRRQGKNSAPTRISPAVEYVNNHFTEDISVGELAQMCFLSEAHLFRLFKSELGMSPIDYKNSLRIRRAKLLLPDTEISVGEVADMLGFDNACYFSRIFKAKTGISPQEFRAKSR